jgi:hypothetical protein
LPSIERDLSGVSGADSTLQRRDTDEEPISTTQVAGEMKMAYPRYR